MRTRLDSDRARMCTDATQEGKASRSRPARETIPETAKKDGVVARVKEGPFVRLGSMHKQATTQGR